MTGHGRIAPLEADATDLRRLAAAADLPPPAVDEPLDDARLEQAALELRRRWLERAHRPADSTLKSPCEGTTARMPGGGRVSFGYERDLDVSVLEAREPFDHAVPAGWTSTRVICRSGQAALSCLLHLVMGLGNGAEAPLRVHHAGRYFETTSLLALWPRRMLEVLPAETPAVDLLIGEPVFCDGRFGVADPEHLPRARRALILDTTLSGAEVDLAPWFERIEGPVAAVFRSGLKLDQAGLELANVGIVQLFARDADIVELAGRLRHIRALTGSGLTLDEMAALSAPWFLDAGYFRRYTQQVFAHNEALARAVDSRMFEECCHPALLADRSDRPAVAPFCALRLRDGDLAAHRRLDDRLEQILARRRLAVAKGGSFGFRGSRYELIEPAPAEGTPFIRIAAGFRGGPSLDGLIDALGEAARG